MHAAANWIKSLPRLMNSPNTLAPTSNATAASEVRTSRSPISKRARVGPVADRETLSCGWSVMSSSDRCSCG
jgi:hypothetical protein